MNLATKYRPSGFDEVVSQEEIKVILQYQLDNDLVKHAYLFCGGAGTGKTTSARIFANEVNGGIGTPIEIDAATNTGVDKMREVIESAQMRPLEGQYKVFIVDECHMLSNGAWNALLKTLEEPPSTAIFIFCTTDPQKIPATIISRVQRFDFKKMRVNQLVGRLLQIIESENVYERDPAGAPEITYETEALEYIAKLAQGGMRDSITNLDKVLDYSDDITMESVIQALGVPDVDEFMDLALSLHNGETEVSLEIIYEMYMSGKELKLTFRNFANFLVEFVKCYFIKDANMIDLPSYLVEEINSGIASNLYSYPRLVDLLKTVNGLANNLKWESNPLPLINLTVITFKEG